MSALLALFGFVVQFVGLGAMHWSATVTVVSVSIVMTIVRAVVRRGLANDPWCILIPEKIELVWVALRVIRGDWDKKKEAPSNSNPLLPRLKVWIRAILTRTVQETPTPQVDVRDCEWGLLTGFIEPRLKDGTSICDTKQDAKQNTNQNANQDEKQDVKQDVNEGTNLEANSITDAISSTDVNVDVLEFNSKLTDATRYMRQLDELSPQKFVLGFGPVSDESPETEAIKDISLTSPKIPLGDFHDLASRLAVAIKGIMDYLNEISGNEIIWQVIDDKPPFANNDWQIDVQQSLGVKTSWVIRTSSYSHVALLDHLKEDLNAGLSLWMYSIACTNSSLNRLYSFHDELRTDNQVSNLPTFQQVTPKGGGCFARIVGSAGSKTDKEIDDWMPFMYRKLVPSYDGKWWNEKKNDYFRVPPIIWRTWPVFGLFYSNSFK